MGAAASTAKKPFSETDCKNSLGVLYDAEAQQAFAAAAQDGLVTWAEVLAYAKAHGLLDQKAVLLKNLLQFKTARDQIQAIYDEHFTGAVCDIPWVGRDLGDERRQLALHGAPAAIRAEFQKARASRRETSPRPELS